MTTPGQMRQFAAIARRDAVELRRMAHETPIRHWEEHWLKEADKREEYADWYESVASRGEITVEYTTIEPTREAAE